MFLVRDAQRFALAREGFVPRGVAHVQRLFPAACQGLGGEGVRELVRYGYDRATGYGLDREADVLRYLTVMFVFGRDFDRDPAHPWAAEVLSSSGELRGARLMSRAREAAAHSRPATRDPH